MSMNCSHVAQILKDTYSFRDIRLDANDAKFIRTHFVHCLQYIYIFNDALNTFYLRLYGVRHMVKDHSDSEKGNPLLPHGLLLSINSKGSFI